MSKVVFKQYNQGQVVMFPMSLDDKIPSNAPVRLVNQIVDSLDISKVIKTYKGGGTSSYHPRMLLKIVLFAYLNNIYSCRKIEKQNLESIYYMWLSNMQTPDHNTINIFRSKHLKNTISDIFTQVVLMLVDMGHLSLDVIYTDGTKMESCANRYTFVWRKSVEKNKAKLEAKERYNKMPQKEVADSGYGSEENYEFMQTNDIEAYVKYPGFHAEQKESFKNNAFIAQNLFYNKEKDYFVCPMGQHMENKGNSTRKSENGYISNTVIYQAKNCKGCPLRGLCHKAEGNRQIEINHKLNEYRRNARELLTCEEGLFHRSRRPIEPESVFGQTKANKQYYRFRHFGLAKVKMDFAIFAIAFNIGKLWNKTNNTSKNQKKSPFFDKNIVIFVFVTKFKGLKIFKHKNLDGLNKMAA